MKKINFTLKIVVFFLNRFGFILIGVAIGLLFDTHVNIYLVIKVAVIGEFFIFESFLLGLKNSSKTTVISKKRIN